MTRTILLGAAFTILALPAFAGFAIPDLPRLDFGSPDIECTPPTKCEAEK